MVGGEIPEGVEVVFWMIPEPPQTPEGAIVVHYPIDDNDQGLDEDVFLRLYHLVDSLSDLRILTVCHAGENRSGLVSTMTLIAREIPVEEAIRTVQANGNANYGDHSFWNPGFVAQVRRLLA